MCMNRPWRWCMARVELAVRAILSFVSEMVGQISHLSPASHKVSSVLFKGSRKVHRGVLESCCRRRGRRRGRRGGSF